VSGALSPVIQPFLGQAVTIAFMAALLMVQPYEKRAHNLVQAVCMLATWAALLVGDSLFNVATYTGAINSRRQDAIGVATGTVLCVWTAGVLMWALDGYRRDVADTLKAKFPTLFVRPRSIAKVVPLLNDGRRSAVDPNAATGITPEDEAHAAALAQVDAIDLERQPRAADGGQYTPSRDVAAAVTAAGR
jgi:hypothetical protein